MTHPRLAHTADLDAAARTAARTLLDEAFDGGFTDQDWEHALGGLHVLVWEGPALIGHGAVVQRRLVHGGRALRTGYVEGVAVRADRRGRGHGAAMMDAVERVIRSAYELGALSASEHAQGFYPARGWQVWRGPTYALTPTGVRRTAQDDGGVCVFASQAPLTLSGDLTCDWRDGDIW